MAGPTLIQIKRSLNTAIPASLANGEFAYSSNGDALYIGANGVIVPVAGKRVPGLLTANQAIVTNSTSMVDKIMLGNTSVNVVVNASSLTISDSTNTVTIIRPTTVEKGGNYYLKADGSWATVTGATADPAGGNTNIQYNDSGTMNGTDAFTYNETTNNVYIANTLSIGDATVNAYFSPTALHFANSTVTFDVTKPTAAQVSAANYYLASDSTWKQVAASGALDDLSDVTIATVGNNQLLVYDAVATQWENHDVGNGFSFAAQSMAVKPYGGITVDTNGVSVNVATTSGLIVNTLGVWVFANNGLVANSTGLHVGTANGITVTADAVGVLANSTSGLAIDTNGVYVIANSGLLTNATGLHIGSGNGIAVDTDSIRAVANSTSGLRVDTNGVNVFANQGLVTNATGLHVVAANGIVSNTLGVWVKANNGITVDANGVKAVGVNAIAVDTTGIYINAATTSGLVANLTGLWVKANNGIAVDTNGVRTVGVNAITVGTSGIDVVANSGLVSNSTGLHISAANGITVGTDTVGAVVGSTLTLNSQGIHVNTNLNIQDLTLGGNLNVTGTLVTVDATNLVVNDSIISLARNNGADTLDIGFYGQYNDGSERFTGLLWDTSADVFELFSNTTVEPTTTVDTGGTGYVRAKLQSYLRTGWGTGLFEANSSGVTITANSTWAVALTANTLSLSTALPGTSGGTGLSTIANQSILVANSTNGFAALAVGSSGFVLQSNSSGGVEWNSLDGGTF